MQSIGEFLNKLQHVKPAGKDQWIANCPCLSHKTPDKHLSVGLRDNTILLTCFGNDTADDITAALGLTLADLFISVSNHTPIGGVTLKIVATYDYKDEKGEFLFQVVRYEPKNFKQRHKNGNGEWVWNLDGVRRVLYRLQDVNLSEEVYIVEGEKDVESLLTWGRIATTSPGGANAWRPEYADYLKGKRIIIIPDKDAAGYAYAKDIVKSLQGKAREIKVILLPGEANDISDWLEAGSTVEQLSEFEDDISVLFSSAKPRYIHVEEAILWEKEITSGKQITFKAENVRQERTGIHARILVRIADLNLSWSYLNVERRDERSSLATSCHSTIKGDLARLYTKDDLRTDLDNFCAGLWDFYISQFVPEEIQGDDTLPIIFMLKPYVLQGGGTIIFAPPGRGKSFTALLWAISIDAGLSTFWATKPAKVLFLNLERSSDSVRRRIAKVNKVLGLEPSRRLFVLNARGRSLFDVLPACRKAIKQHKVEVIVLDSISRAGLGDLTENISGNRVIDALSSLCPTWVALGHTPRSSEDHIYGSVMQDAGADIVVQLSSQVKEDGTLGIGYQISKQNDIGYYKQDIYAFEFEEGGLTNFRKARSYEFSDIEGNTHNKPDMLSTIIDYIANQDRGDATATQISHEFGYDRTAVSKLLNQSGRFVETRKVKQSVYYGVKEDTVV